MKKSKLLLILALVVVLALGVLVSCKGECTHENYGAWSLTKAPTLNDAGEAVRVCADCGVAETATVAKLSDTSVWTPATTSATHTTAGKTTYTSTYGKVEIAIDRLTAHVYDKEVATEAYLVSAADCTHAAVYRKSCVCGAVSTATFTSGNALGHDGKAVESVAAVHNATTLTNGTEAHYKCDRCGKLFSDAACTTEVTAASLVVTVAHNYGGWTLVADATCTTDGSVTHECTVCHKVETNAIPAHNHVYTNGKIVVVTSKDVYQEEDTGEIIEGDEEATEFHAPVCDICKVINKDAKSAHTYGDWELVAIAEQNGHCVYEQKTCSACNYSTFNYTNNDGAKKSHGYLEIHWTLDEEKSVAPTYTSTGLAVYNKDNLTVSVIVDKLIAPYEGKTYRPLRVESKSDVVSGKALLTTSWVNALLTLDDKGQGKGGGSPYNGNVTMTYDAATNAVVMRVDDSIPVNGYIEPLTGIMVLQDSSKGFAWPYIITPYDWTSSSSVVASYWPNGMAITYHVDCGTYTGHDVNIFINDDEVMFGVTFTDANGAIVAAADCYAQDMLIVKSGDNVVATFVKNSDGVLQVADEYLGEYTTTGSAVGTLVVDGIGGFVLNITGGGSVSGTYSATATKDVFDAYVIVNGKKVEHHVATMDVENHTASLAASTVEVTFVPGSHGTLTPAKQNVFTNCEITAVPTTTDYIFIGWFTKDGTDDDWGDNVTSVTAATTLYAKYTQEVDITLVNAIGGDKVISVKKSETISSQIAKVEEVNYTNATVNVAERKLFAGWFTDANCTEPLDPQANATSADMRIYAKWVPAGTWSTFFSSTGNTSPYAYDSENNRWYVAKKSGSPQYSYFYAYNDDVVVSFSYWFENGHYNDYIKITMSGTTYADVRGNASAASTPTKLEIRMTVGQELRIETKFDYSTGIYLSDLTVNGKAITKPGKGDLYAGTYTCDGTDDLTLDGYGAFVWGTKEGTYTIKNNKIMLVVVEDSEAVAGYTVTLTGNTFAYETQKVTLTLHLGTVSNENKVGDTTTTPETVVVDAYKPYVIPTPTQTFDGKVFLSWHKGTWLSAAVLDVISPSEDMDIYGRYVDSVVITYNDTVNDYDNKTVAVPKSTALGKFLLVPETTVDGDKVFAGWFTKDGDNWGNEISDTSTLSADVTVYAKWLTPNALMGYYQGLRIQDSDSSVGANSGKSYTLRVKPDGTIVSTYSDFNGKTIVANEDGTYSIVVSQTSKYFVKYDAANGWLIASTSTSGATFSSPIVFKAVSNFDTDIFNAAQSKRLVRYNNVSYALLNVNNQPLYVSVGGTSFVTSVTIEVFDKTGTKVDNLISTDINNGGFLMTVNNGDANLAIGYKTYVGWTECTMAYGKFTSGNDTVWLNGAGFASLNGAEGTATAVAGESNKVALSFTNSAHIVTVNTTNNTCTIADDKVTISFDFGITHNDAHMDAIQWYRNVNLRSADFSVPTIDGYKYRGWYLTAAREGYGKNAEKFAQDSTIYLLYDPAVTLTYNYTTAGIDATVVTDKFKNDTIGTLHVVAADAYPDHKFDAWYSKDGSTTGDWGTKIKTDDKLTGNTTVYAKWFNPATVTYNYLVNGVENPVVSGVCVNDTFGTLQTVDASINPTCKFDAWYSKDGSQDGDWGDQIYGASTIKTENTIVYARWLAPVTATFNYLVDGADNGTTTGKFEKDSVGDLPTGTANMNPGKVIEGWYTKDGSTTGDWGTKISSSTKLAGNVTFYAKWITPAASAGTYGGFNMYSDGTSGNVNLTGGTLTINSDGSYNQGYKLGSAGTLASKDFDVTDGAIMLDRYAYVNTEAGIIWYGWSANQTYVGDDTCILFDTSRVASAVYSGRKDKTNNSYTAYITITYKNGSTMNVFCYNSKIYANVSWDDGVDAKAANTTSSLTIKNKDGTTIFTQSGSTITAA